MTVDVEPLRCTRRRWWTPAESCACWWQCMQRRHARLYACARCEVRRQRVWAELKATMVPQCVIKEDFGISNESSTEDSGEGGWYDEREWSRSQPNVGV